MFKEDRLLDLVQVTILVISMTPAAAFAAQRTFVSTTGSDANLCTRSAPCRSFGAASLLTDAGGEIVVLDSGGYGAVTIDRSVALIAPSGVHAAVSVFTGHGITISAGASDVVVVRGLYLTGLGGSRGISFDTGGVLHVENCVVSGFTGSGIFGGADPGSVYVKDSISRNNLEGFRFQSTSDIEANLDSVRAEENSDAGVAAYEGSVVTVTRSVAAGNGAGANFYAGASGILNVEDCTAVYAFYGVYASAGTVRVSRSMITGNTNGVVAGAGANTISFGNNRVDGNGTNGTFTTTVTECIPEPVSVTCSSYTKFCPRVVLVNNCGEPVPCGENCGPGQICCVDLCWSGPACP